MAMEPNGSATFQVAIHRAMGSYIARVQELPGCIGRGATEVEAVERARESIRAYLQVTRALEGDRATVQVQIRV